MAYSLFIGEQDLQDRWIYDGHDEDQHSVGTWLEVEHA